MNLRKFCQRILIISTLVWSINVFAAAPATVDDPYESFNRPIYAFNTKVDKFFLKPIAKVYHKILPWPVTKSITNFFSNLGDIPTVFNDLLQGNFYQATSDTWRFGINSTIGIAGLFDVASHIGLPKNNQDFGLTLAKWGYTSSHYLVLPLLGPSTIRDTLGLPMDYATSAYPYIDDATSYTLYGANVVNNRANLLNYDSVLAQAFDQYVFIRNAYMQKRDSQIHANEHRSLKEITSENKHYSEMGQYTNAVALNNEQSE